MYALGHKGHLRDVRIISALPRGPLVSARPLPLIAGAEEFLTKFAGGFIFFRWIRNNKTMAFRL
jgi:hypothetical protein